MIQRSLIISLISILCSHLYGQPVYTPVLVNTGDSYVSKSAPSATPGSSTDMTVKITTAGTDYTRAFIKFDLSGIPQNARIVSAKLRLTANGSEGADISNSSLVLEQVTSDWDESSISWDTSPDVTTSAAMTTSSLIGGKRVFDMKTLVSMITAHRTENHGWRIRRNDETTTTLGSTYFTKESATSTNRPVLEVVYYFPFEISSAVISHATDLAATDGSIHPQIIKGSGGTAAYQWYKSDGTALATTQNLDNVPYGWYGLRITGALSHVAYYAFLVGVQGTDVDIAFNPGPNYTEEAMIYNRIHDGDQANSNLDNYAYYLASNWGATGDWYDAKFLVKYKLWMDPALTVNQSDLHLTGYTHYNALRANTAEFARVSAPWDEIIVTFNNAPPIASDIVEVVPSTTSSTQNSVVDLNDFWNFWKADNTANYGAIFQLQLYNFVRSRQQYTSSNSTEGGLPYIQFNVEIPYVESLATLSYYELKENFDGGYAKTADGKLKFYFSEEYKIDAGKYLPLKIYDASHAFKGAVDLEGNITGLAGMPLLNYHFEDNRYLADLSALGLDDGKLYILEVTTSTGEKRYLKFLFKN